MIENVVPVVSIMGGGLATAFIAGGLLGKFKYPILKLILWFLIAAGIITFGIGLVFLFFIGKSLVKS